MALQAVPTMEQLRVEFRVAGQEFLAAADRTVVQAKALGDKVILAEHVSGKSGGTLFAEIKDDIGISERYFYNVKLIAQRWDELVDEEGKPKPASVRQALEMLSGKMTQTSAADVEVIHQAAKEHPEKYGHLVKELANGRPVAKVKNKLTRLRLIDRLAHMPVPEESGIICADALGWMKAQPENSIPFILSDPPFGIGLKYDGWKERGTPQTYWRWLERYWEEMQRICCKGGLILLFQSQRHLASFPNWFGEDAVVNVECFTMRTMRHWVPFITWVKPGAEPLSPGCIGKVGNWIDTTDDNEQQNPLVTDHPCPKPLSACLKVIDNYTTRSAFVLDPFCGVGGIPLACKKLGRKYLGIDRSMKYVEEAKKRLAEVDDK